MSLEARLIASIRALTREAKGIREEIRYHNERAFPPLHEKRDVKAKPPIISGTPKRESDYEF